MFVLNNLTQLNLIKRYSPAVTKVEECTKAETGVGALIAAGSHLIKGNCALLVHNPVNNSNHKQTLIFKFCWSKRSLSQYSLTTTKQVSPNRLVKKVNILPLCATHLV